MSVPDQQFTHAWEHFKVHATQRMQHWQYSLTFTGAIFAVIAAAAEFEAWDLVRMASGIGFGATAVFWALDLRTRDLVRAAETALKSIELDFAANNTKAPIAIFHRTEHHAVFGLSYTQAFGLLFLLNAGAFIVIAFGTELGQMVDAISNWLQQWRPDE